MGSYKKRAGTSGISGQLYETKLITLLEFRLLHDDNVQQFHLASNIDDIGAFDDVCVKITIRGVQRPILAFLQAKHKEDDDTVLKYDLIKHFHFSYLKLKQKFNASKGRARDALFNGSFEDTECVFILYTNAKYYNDLDSNKKHSEQSDTIASSISQQARKPYESPFACTLNSLVATGDRAPRAVQLDYSQDDIQLVSDTILQEEVVALAEHFAKFVNNKSNQSNALNDEYMERYHVILSRTVLCTAEDTAEDALSQAKDWQWLAFRRDFFYSDDDVITTIRNKVYELVIKNRGKAKKSKAEESKSETTTVPDDLIDHLISAFLCAPSAMTLSPLIGSRITHANGTLQFAVERSYSEVDKLEHVDISQSTIDEAESLAAARNLLQSLKLKVPLHFGNYDITITGSDKKVDKRLTHLTNAFVDLCRTFVIRGQYRIVTIDDSLGKGLLSCNGGIGGAVGNLLVYDERTKCLKFTEDATNLRVNARALMDRLMSSEEMDDLHFYRFNVTAQQFPRLVFDCSEEAEGILSKLLIYEQQSNHHGVEDILQDAVRLRFNANNTHDLPVNSDIMLIYYHHEVQKWWMAQKTGTYLTKDDNIYNDVASTIVLEPQMSALQVMFNMSNIKYFGYGLNDDPTDTLISVELAQVIVVTNSITLTIIKVIHCLKNKYAVLDLECLINLPQERLYALNNEVSKTDKTIIIVCENVKNKKNVHRTLELLSESTKDKHVILITNKSCAATIQEYFPSTFEIYNDNQTLDDLNNETQKDILTNTTVIFQGQEINLNLLAKGISLQFIKGAVLDQIIQNKSITLSDPFKDTKYEEIKDLYIERRICRIDSDESSHDSLIVKDYNNYDVRCLVKTFHDVADDNVLITAKPGMGKSTLLTHLSIKTKERDRLRWILRINLLDYSEVFYKWSKRETVIDTAETLKFLCHVVLKDNSVPISLKVIKGKVHLENYTGDEWTAFKLNMFLHSYNKRKLIVVFDGFDEICPHYKDVVLKLLKVVKNYRQKIKLWVATRPYSNILPDLEAIFSKCYELEYINPSEQWLYLENYWRMKLNFELLSEVQLANVTNFIDMLEGRPETMSSLDRTIIKIYNHFDYYLRWHFPHIDEDKTCKYNSDSDTDCSDELETSSSKSNGSEKADTADANVSDNDIEPDKLTLEDEPDAENSNDDDTETSETNTSNSSSKFSTDIDEPVSSEYYLRWDRYSIDSATSDTARLDLDIFFSESADRMFFPPAPEAGRISKQVNKFMGTPLLLYMIADYFVSIINEEKVTQIWDINVPGIYEMFIETKLKRILFEDKNKMDVYYPDIITKYEKELVDCINVHKKLGALAIFGNPVFNKLNYNFDELKDVNPFTDEDFKEFDAIIKKIRSGTEKSGFINYITTDNMPIFVHKSFAEYFAAQYVIDILKDEKIDFTVKKLIYAVIDDSKYFSSIQSWLMKTRRINTDLNRIIIDLEDGRLQIFTRDCRAMFNNLTFSEEEWIRISCSAAENYQDGYFNKLDMNSLLKKLDEGFDKCILEIEGTIFDNMKPSFREYFGSGGDETS